MESAVRKCMQFLLLHNERVCLVNDKLGELETSLTNIRDLLMGFYFRKSFQISFYYSGRRLAVDSLRMIYYNDQTIAIVELGPEKLLLSCELIEI